VNVRFENVRDRHTVFSCHVDVNVTVRARIENCGDSFVIIAHEIGKLGNARCLNGLKNK